MTPSGEALETNVHDELPLNTDCPSEKSGALIAGGTMTCECRGVRRSRLYRRADFRRAGSPSLRRAHYRQGRVGLVLVRYRRSRRLTQTANR
jgi:hypothetical protein